MPKARKGDSIGKPVTTSKSAGNRPYSKDNNGHHPLHSEPPQAKSGHVNASERLSLSAEILSQISKPTPSPSRSATTSSTSVIPAVSQSVPTRQKSGKRKRDRAEAEDSLSDENATLDQESTVEIRHSPFWQECVPSEPGIYSSLIVKITKIADKSHPETDQSTAKPIVCRTLCFVTRAKAPIEASDPFPVSAMLCSVSRFGFNCRPGPSVNLTDPEAYSNMRRYTLKLMTIMSRLQTFEIPESEMPYFLAPVRQDLKDTANILDSQSVIDWEEVNAFATEDGRMLERHEVADVDRLQRIVNDGLWGYRYTDVSARFEVAALRQDLSTLSIVDAPDGEKQTIHSLQPRRWKEALEAQQIDLWDGQPIFELEPSLDLHAMLRPTSSLRTRFIMPQLIKKCNLSLSTYHSLFAVPALVQALDFVLVAKELVHTYGLRTTSTQRAMEAISLPTADLGSSYERLEWYGDSCCDVVAAIYAYYAHVQHGCDMGDLQKIKEQLVVNQHQSAAAKRSGLVNYLRAVHVHTRHWIPLVVSTGQASAYSFLHSSSVRVGIKTTADVLESVVGAFVLCNGFDKIFKIFRKLGFHFEVPVKIKRLRDIPSPVIAIQPAAGASENTISRLQRIIAYEFDNKRLFEFAVMNPSNSECEINLRYLLYRLGSSVLHHLLAEWLFARHTEWDVSSLSAAHDFYNQPCHTAKIATKTGLEHIFPDKGAGQAHIPDTRVSTTGQEVKHAWLLKASEGSQMQRLDVRFKYLLAIIFIDSQWSWSSGPRKVFDHLCTPVLETLRLPDLKNMHPRQVLERMMRKRQCQALEVRKSTSDSGAVVEGESSSGEWNDSSL